jgi:hypothetical protein
MNSYRRALWNFTRKFWNCEAPSFTNFWSALWTRSSLTTDGRPTSSLFIVNIFFALIWTFYTIVLQFLRSLHFGHKLLEQKQRQLSSQTLTSALNLRCSSHSLVVHLCLLFMPPTDCSFGIHNDVYHAKTFPDRVIAHSAEASCPFSLFWHIPAFTWWVFSVFRVF